MKLTPAILRPLGLRLVHTLHPAERLILAMIAALGLATVALTIGLQRQVNWPPFLVGIIATLLMVAIGAYARSVSAAPRLAYCAIGVGLFMGFTAFSTVFIFALFPLPNPLIDSQLVKADALLGYSWAGYVDAMAHYPDTAKALRLVYNSALPQIVLTILLLGALGRETQLHRFLLVGIVAMIFTTAIWWVWPSVGPSVVSASLPQATGRVYDASYGPYLRQLVAVGPPIISPEMMAGVVGFPSYHLIMACMVVWFTRGTFAAIPAVLINAAMIPATLLHGQHHLIDLFGGVAIFLLSARLAVVLVPGHRPEPPRVARA